MNGRMYDPVLGRFLSPDPFVQAPDFSQNFNRYAYCLNNPFKYTDPDGELFYIDLGIGWSKSGGFSISLGAGIGFKNGLSAGFSIGYETGNNSFSFNVNASYAGSYISSGYNTSAGFTTSTGYGYGVQVGIFSFSVFTASAGYSQNGGFSTNVGWVNYNQYSGFSANPSVGVSYTANTGYYGSYEIEAENIESTAAPIYYSTKSALEFMKNNNLETDEIAALYADGTFPSNYVKKGDAVYNKKTNNEIGGLTKHMGKKYLFWGKDVIYMYLAKKSFSSPELLYLTIGHELVHVHLHYMGYHDHNRHEKTAYDWSIRQTETWGLTKTKAYSDYTKMYNSYKVKSYPYVRPVRTLRPIR